MLEQRIIRSVNGFTTGTLTRNAERFFVASKKATPKEVEVALDKLVKSKPLDTDISFYSFFSLFNHVNLNGMDIAVASKTLKDKDHIYTRVCPASSIKGSEFGKWGSSIRELFKDENIYGILYKRNLGNKDTTTNPDIDNKIITFSIKPSDPQRHMHNTWTTHSNGATQEEIHDLERLVVEWNI